VNRFVTSFAALLLHALLFYAWGFVFGNASDSGMKVLYWRAFSRVLASMLAWMFGFCFALTPFGFVLLGR
jgi:uncharacterized membrane-anchored protein